MLNNVHHLFMQYKMGILV